MTVCGGKSGLIQEYEEIGENVESGKKVMEEEEENWNWLAT
jgi:hypothetical protein